VLDVDSDVGQLFDDIVVSSFNDGFVGDLGGAFGHDSCKYHCASTSEVGTGNISAFEWSCSDDEGFVRIENFCFSSEIF